MGQVLGHAQPAQAARIVLPAAAETQQHVDLLGHVDGQAAHARPDAVLEAHSCLLCKLDPEIAESVDERGHARALGEGHVEARRAKGPVHVGTPQIV